MEFHGLTRNQKAEHGVSTATSQRQALEAAIDAAECYMKALKLASTKEDKHHLDLKCKEWITRAEQIKKAKTWQPAARADARRRSRLTEPVSTRKLSTREEIILLEGAKLNGFIFPPWTTPPDPEEFELDHREGPFVYVQILKSPSPQPHADMTPIGINLSSVSRLSSRISLMVGSDLTSF